MTLHQNSSKPKALVYGLGSDEEVAKSLVKYGLESRFQADPRAFLYALHSVNPALVFITVEAHEHKVVRALLMSVRKVLGIGLPVYAVVAETDHNIMSNLMEWGATGVLVRPFDGPKLVELLRKNVVTEELVQEVSVTSSASTIPESFLPKDGEIHPLAEWIFERVFPVMAHVSSALESFDEIESKVRFYAERIAPYGEQFAAYVNSLRKGSADEALDVQQCVRFYGIANARALVLSHQLLEGIRGEGIRWDEKTGRPLDDPSKVLSYGRRLLEHFGEDSLYREVALMSGIVFDLLHYHSENQKDRKGALKKDLDNRVRIVAEKATQGINKAKSMENLPLAKHIVTSHAMGEAAKALMFLLFKEYADFTKSADKAKVRGALRIFAEETRFAISHNVVGAMLAQVTPGLADAALAILCGQHQYLLNDTSAESGGMQALAQIYGG